MRPPPRSKGSSGGLTTYRGVTRSMTRRQRNSLPVPDDLAMDIFSRLPSKAMARCRCTSKLLSSMLRSQDFTDSFFTKSCARPQLLFVCEDHGEFIFISSPQPENPEENSYVVASNPRVIGDWIIVEHQVLTLGTKKLLWRLVECCIPHVPSSKWICISGVLYYAARTAGSDENSMVVFFDLRSEKSSSVNFGKAMPGSTALVNYGGKLGLLMSGDHSHYVARSSTSFELWVLLDAAKHEWSNHVYALLPSWEVVVAETMCIAGMAGTSEIVLSPRYQRVPYYVIYYNVERNTITKVGIQGLEPFQGKSFHTYLNYVPNVKLL